LRCREPECPNKAIYEGGKAWSLADGTALKGNITLLNGTIVDAAQWQRALSNDIYYIVPDKCTECQGFHEEPQCAAVCCVEAPVPDKLYRETIEELLAKKEKMHI